MYGNMTLIETPLLFSDVSYAGVGQNQAHDQGRITLNHASLMHKLSSVSMLLLALITKLSDGILVHQQNFVYIHFSRRKIHRTIQ